MKVRVTVDGKELSVREYLVLLGAAVAMAGVAQLELRYLMIVAGSALALGAWNLRIKWPSSTDSNTPPSAPPGV